MRIRLSCGLYMDDMIALLESYQGSTHYKALERAGLKTTFLVEGETANLVAQTKRIIRSTSLGKNLIFQVEEI